MNFVRPSLREALIRVLEQRILEGTLKGELRETDLAASLDVSRTPIREALIALQRDGMVESTPGRGFRVPPLKAVDIEEAYPLLGALEAAALRHSPRPAPAEWLDELENLNRAFDGATRDARSAVVHDTRWHSLLIGRTRNQRMLILARRTRTRLRRYEFAYLAEPVALQRSVEEHAEIIDALRRGRTEAAARRLDRHWCSGVEPMLARLARGGGD
jgi:DNA-binding GntR family transcriptional regulator